MTACLRISNVIFHITSRICEKLHKEWYIGLFIFFGAY